MACGQMEQVLADGRSTQHLMACDQRQRPPGNLSWGVQPLDSVCRTLVKTSIEALAGGKGTGKFCETCGDKSLIYGAAASGKGNGGGSGGGYWQDHLNAKKQREQEEKERNAQAAREDGVARSVTFAEESPASLRAAGEEDRPGVKRAARGCPPRP